MNRANALALATALALGGAACDASKVRPIEPSADVNDCSRCHGYPPPANGPFLMPTTTAHPTSQNCNGCHPGTVEADNVSIVPGGLHMNGVVDVTGGHAMPYTAQHAAAALAGIASCTACHGADYGGGSGPSCNACHAAIATGGPDWKANCTFCHGTRTAGVTTATSKAAPPQAVDATADQTRANPSVGAHQAHLVAGTIAPAMPCDACHAVPASAEALTHFTGGGAPAKVAFGALATKGAAGAAYAAGACAVYCHGAGTEFGSPSGKTSPQWTSTGVGCTTCHGNPPASGPAISGQTAHAFHVTGRSVACATCHPVPPGQLASHVNGTKDVVVQPAGGGTRTIAGWDCTACHDALGVAAAHPLPYVADHTSAALASISSCTSCHGADYGGGSAQSCNACHAAVAASGPDWKTNCTFCHGTRTAGVTTATSTSAPPQSVVVTADQTRTNPKIGAHQAHLVAGSIAGAMPCASCHQVPAQAQALTHFTGNGAPGAIAFDATATKGVTGATYTGGTCNVYCHGAGTEFGSPAGKASPTWTSTGVTCTTCHGNPPASHSASSTSCNTCHPGTVNANGTINVAGGLHVNGVKDATSAHPQGWGLASQHGYSVNQTGLASCKTCHGATLTGGSGPSCASCHAQTVAGWDTSCTFCHGDRSTGRASPPVDTQGRSVTTNVSVGVHASHVGTTIAASIACGQCHPARSTSVISDAAHIDGDGVAEVSFGALARTGGAAPQYTRASATAATCASTYCHGRFTGGASSGAGATVSWTSTTQVTCSSCHPSPPVTGRHTLHLGRGYGCGSCHPSYTSTSVNAALHVNGVKNVVPTNGTSVGTYNSSTGTCSSFGCHGSQTW